LGSNLIQYKINNITTIVRLAIDAINTTISMVNVIDMSVKYHPDLKKFVYTKVLVSRNNAAISCPFSESVLTN
jgi:hypothetical protein